MTGKKEQPQIDRATLLARFLAEYGVRNSELENLHSGSDPRTKTGDYTDVIVKTPFGDIPWRDVGRITDPEMRELMLSVEKGLILNLRRIEEYERLGTLRAFLEAIRKEKFSPNGVTWDISPTKWDDRQETWRRLQSKNSNEST